MKWSSRNANSNTIATKVGGILLALSLWGLIMVLALQVVSANETENEWGYRSFVSIDTYSFYVSAFQRVNDRYPVVHGTIDRIVENEHGTQYAVVLGDNGNEYVTTADHLQLYEGFTGGARTIYNPLLQVDECTRTEYREHAGYCWSQIVGY